jgi:hypothetical protein
LVVVHHNHKYIVTGIRALLIDDNEIDILPDVFDRKKRGGVINKLAKMFDIKISLSFYCIRSKAIVLLALIGDI